MASDVGIIACRVENTDFGFEKLAVVAVCSASALRPLSAPTSDGVIGYLASIGSSEVPVARLSDCVRSERKVPRPVAVTELRKAQVIIARTKLGPVGFLVDVTPRAINVPGEHVCAVSKLLNDSSRALVQSVAVISGADQARSLCWILTPDRLNPTADLSGHLPQPPIVHRASSATARSVESQAGRIVVFVLRSRIEHPDNRQSNTLSQDNLLGALSSTQVVEILDDLPIFPVPYPSKFVDGAVICRNAVLPRLRLGATLGLPVEPRAERLVIARTGDELVAIPAAQTPIARRLPLPHQPCDIPSGFNRENILGAFRSESEVLVVPDLARLFKPLTEQLSRAMPS